MYYYKSINGFEYIIRLLFKLAVVISSVYGIWGCYSSLNSLTYFTQLSNIFLAIVFAFFFFIDLITLISNGRKDYNCTLFYVIKFMATISITVTLLVFAFILAPVMGGYYQAYFSGNCASFFVHLFSPVLAILDFMIFDRFKSKPIYAFYAIVPALCYLGFVLFMNQVFNYTWEGMNAPYNFINFGAPCGWFGFELGTFSKTTVGIGVFYMIILLIIIFLVIGSIFLLINRKIHRIR